MQDSRDSPVQAIARAGQVLRALEQAPAGLALGDLAQEVGLAKSTVHRLVAALAAEDLATTAGGRVRLGLGLARLGAAAGRALRDELRPVLLALREELDETVDLAVLEGGAVRFVDQLPAPHRLRAESAVGATFPVHNTANGKALLAALAPEQAAALVASLGAPARRRLLAELEDVRRTGVAFDREEHTEGICAVGAAVLDETGPVAAISVPAPTQRFARHEARYAAKVRDAAARASRSLGGR